MKQAIIDIGSNSMRLTLYETQDKNFKILFREKIMAGLAGYVKDEKLSTEGIERACEGLLSFRSILETLQIDNIHVFATASLRNIANTSQALAVIQASTNFHVEIIDGKEEALLGYIGAMEELHMTSGAFLDVGGASSEIVTFDNSIPMEFNSFPIGSLNLYHHCVKKIIPGKGSLKRLKDLITSTFEKSTKETESRPFIVGVGGTARATLKLAKEYYSLEEECHYVTSKQVDDLCKFLCSEKKEAIELILKQEPERIHTIIPGILVIQHVMHLFHAEKLIISKYGVREGYLCQKILQNNTVIPKIEN